jgi:ATP-dependent DNA helicase RecQ
VYERAVRDADGSGLLRTGPEAIAGELAGKVSGREVESALRVLVRAGALRAEGESASRVFVRLLATPERIKRELNGELDVERELLRALWRAAGKALNDGAAIELEGLPPGFGGAAGIIPLLEALQSRQFVTWERAGGGMRLANRRAPLADFDVDWAGLERRRKGEMAKLADMQSYAYTARCRRGFVLRYFGDPAARDRCEGCDNCLHIRHEFAAAPPAEGARPYRSKSAERRAGGRGERAAPPAELVVGPDDAPLFGELRALRGAIAREEQVPAYVVFADRTLAEIAVRKPRSLAALSEVRGVGPAKLEKYGERFLALIRSSNETEAA